MLTLPEIKSHLRIEGAEEDAILSLYASAALEYVNAFTRKDWTAETDIPASVRIGALLVVGDLYENREAQGPAALYANKTVERLLWPYRVWQ